MLAQLRADMNIVLEVFDTFFFDYVYATLLHMGTPSVVPNSTLSAAEAPLLQKTYGNTRPQANI